MRCNAKEEKFMIRKFQKADIPQVMNLWLNGNKDAHPFISARYWESNYEMVQEQILQAEVYVCEIQGKIRGFIGIADHFIAGIFVAADYRSHGTGKQLLDYVKQKHSSLSLQVYEKNDRAAAFYLREGFHVSSSGYDESTGETEYIMDWEP